MVPICERKNVVCHCEREVKRRDFLQRHVINRFPTDTSKFKDAVWTLHGTVLAYGKDEKTTIKFFGHNDQEDGSWTELYPPISFNPTLKVSTILWKTWYVM